MAPRLPALAALRSFEAAARHLNFTRAAEELNVSQSAVSHQIRALERDLGCALFERRPRDLRLTRPGRTLQSVVGASFSQLQEVVGQIRRGDAGSIAISLSYPIGATWLARHLAGFARRHPKLEIRLQDSWRLVDLKREGIDLAIRWGRGPWPGVDATYLLPADLVVLAAPGFDAGDPATAPLLHLEGTEPWRRWFRAAGLDPAAAARGPILGDPLSLTRAAEAGDGLILNRLPLVLEALQEGRLVMPFATACETDQAYWLVQPAGVRPAPLCQALIDHLLAAAAADRAAIDRLRPGSG